MEYIGLEGEHKLVVVVGIALCLDELCDPGKLFVDVGFVVGAELIFPMRGDTELCNVVHLVSTYLHLKGYTVASDNCGMKRAIHIWLRGGDVILEASGHGFEKLVNETENGIALKFGIDDYAERIKIVDLVKCLALIIHFPIKAVNRFYTAFKEKIDIVLAKLCIYLGTRGLDKSETQAVFSLDLTRHLVVSYRVKI